MSAASGGYRRADWARTSRMESRSASYGTACEYSASRQYIPASCATSLSAWAGESPFITTSSTAASGTCVARRRSRARSKRGQSHDEAIHCPRNRGTFAVCAVNGRGSSVGVPRPVSAQPIIRRRRYRGFYRLSGAGTTSDRVRRRPRRTAAPGRTAGYVSHSRGVARAPSHFRANPDAQAQMFLDRGFTVNQFGTSFGLRLRHFSLRGTPKMQLRNKVSRARKAGLRVVELGRELPRDENTFAQLRLVSAEWLRGKGKELDFMIGEIGGPEELSRRIFIVQDVRGEAVGFITYVPAWGKTPGYLHDLTRRMPTAPAGAMELCNACAIERMVAEGVEFLHFGFTPFITDGVEFPGANRM